jgi:hypothetical protein
MLKYSGFIETSDIKGELNVVHFEYTIWYFAGGKEYGIRMSRLEVRKDKVL